MTLDDSVFRGELLEMLSAAQGSLDTAWQAVMSRQATAAHLSVRRAKEKLARLEETLARIPAVIFTREAP